MFGRKTSANKRYATLCTQFDKHALAVLTHPQLYALCKTPFGLRLASQIGLSALSSVPAYYLTMLGRCENSSAILKVLGTQYIDTFIDFSFLRMICRADDPMPVLRQFSIEQLAKIHVRFIEAMCKNSCERNELLAFGYAEMLRVSAFLNEETSHIFFDILDMRFDVLLTLPSDLLLLVLVSPVKFKVALTFKQELFNLKFANIKFLLSNKGYAFALTHGLATLSALTEAEIKLQKAMLSSNLREPTAYRDELLFLIGEQFILRCFKDYCFFKPSVDNQAYLTKLLYIECGKLFIATAKGMTDFTPSPLFIHAMSYAVDRAVIKNSTRELHFKKFSFLEGIGAVKTNQQYMTELIGPLLSSIKDKLYQELIQNADDMYQIRILHAVISEINPEEPPLNYIQSLASLIEQTVAKLELVNEKITEHFSNTNLRSKIT